MPNPTSTLRKPDRPVAPSQKFKDDLIVEALSEFHNPIAELYPTAPVSRSRTLWIVAAATLAALLVGVPALLIGVFQPETPAGPGTPVDNPSTTIDNPSTTIEVAEFATWQEWVHWRNGLNHRLEQDAALAWLIANGFEVVEPSPLCDNVLLSEGFTPPSGERPTSGEIPEALLRAVGECESAGWAAIPAFEPAELPHWYESLVAMNECIAQLNYDVPPPPTFDDFVKNLNSPDAWTPGPPRNFEAVSQICPWPLDHELPLWRG